MRTSGLGGPASRDSSISVPSQRTTGWTAVSAGSAGAVQRTVTFRSAAVRTELRAGPSATTSTLTVGPDATPATSVTEAAPSASGSPAVVPCAITVMSPSAAR
jgi:hypothetical protein